MPYISAQIGEKDLTGYWYRSESKYSVSARKTTLTRTQYIYLYTVFYNELEVVSML